MASSTDDRGRQAVEISNAMTRSHRDHFGRGAGSVKTVIQGGYVITFLEDIYTPLERTLINAGKGDLVMEARFAFQNAMREQYIELIETVTGRKVRAFLSQNHIGPDIAAELFVLDAIAGELPDVNVGQAPSPA